MQKAREKNYRVDFIAVHAYHDVSNATVMTDVLKSLMVSLYDQYGLPIWLTEYGAIDIAQWFGAGVSTGYTKDNAVLYCMGTGEMLESLGFVERYAWFVDNVKESGSDRSPSATYTTLYTSKDTISYTGIAYRDIVSGVSMNFETTELEPYTMGDLYSFDIKVSGGEGPYTYMAEGLPEGLAIDDVTGEIVGYAEEEIEATVKVTATDVNGQYIYKNLTLSPVVA
jgi:hypothetical protein